MSNSLETKHKIEALEKNHQKKIEEYYRVHSSIYDMSRWFFLFGRRKLVELISINEAPKTIFEIGCGTGYSLPKFAKKFPDSSVYGIDGSSRMLKKAGRKVSQYSKLKLLHEIYGSPSDLRPGKTDLIIFSYVMSMMNPHFEEMILQAFKDLNKGGIIAVVDFQESKYNWYHRMMAKNHVRLNDHLLPVLRKHFRTKIELSKSAYLGIWRYFIFIGEKV
jgi:S-adenosylmethionine-diacylgycerolhomoserine-N-methlytransferase